MVWGGNQNIHCDLTTDVFVADRIKSSFLQHSFSTVVQKGTL